MEKEGKPLWMKKKKEEAEEIIVEEAKKGTPVAKIGLVLRDTHGIPNIKMLTGKKISKILEEKGIAVKDDVLNKKREGLKKHLEKNKQDQTAKKSLKKLESKIAKSRK